jgi:hypothetical protein
LDIFVRWEASKLLLVAEAHIIRILDLTVPQIVQSALRTTSTIRLARTLVIPAVVRLILQTTRHIVSAKAEIVFFNHQIAHAVVFLGMLYLIVAGIRQQMAISMEYWIVSYGLWTDAMLGIYEVRMALAFKVVMTQFVFCRLAFVKRAHGKIIVTEPVPISRYLKLKLFRSVANYCIAIVVSSSFLDKW